MGKLIDIETIRKEIGRLGNIVIYLCDNSDEVIGYNFALDTLEQFLDTLPEEKPVDLEKELISWWDKHYSRKDYEFEKMNGHYIENTTLLEIAEHFFNLGRMAKKD